MNTLAPATPHDAEAWPDQPAELLRALGHPVRLAILDCLRSGEHTVGEIETVTGIIQPGLSQHLGVLRKANLVSTRREAKHIHYRIDTDTLLAVRGVLDSFLGLAPSPESTRLPVTDKKQPGWPSRASGVAVFARVTRP